MTQRAKRVTDATGPGNKYVGTCLAVCAHEKAGRGEAGICAVGDITADIKFDAKHPAVVLPVVPDLTTCEEYWGIDDVAID